MVVTKNKNVYDCPSDELKKQIISLFENISMSTKQTFVLSAYSWKWTFNWAFKVFKMAEKEIDNSEKMFVLKLLKINSTFASFSFSSLKRHASNKSVKIVLLVRNFDSNDLIAAIVRLMQAKRGP